MKKLYPIAFLLLLFIPSLKVSAQSFLQKSTISISGQVCSENTNEEIANATVTIKRSKMGVICDSTGVFHLQIQEKDTLIVSALGYEMQEWPVPVILNPDFPPFCKIKLKDISYLLKEVDIYALGTWDEFREEFIKTKIKEKNPINKDISKELAPYNTKEPNPVPAEYRPKVEGKMNVADAIFRPTDFLHNKLSRTEKAKKKISRAIRNEKTNNKINKKYNAQIVSEVTGLTDNDLTHFMEFCNEKINVTENSTDYNIIKQILDLFEEYSTTKE